jgi:hypothetical protein
MDEPGVLGQILRQLNQGRTATSAQGYRDKTPFGAVIAAVNTDSANGHIEAMG